MTSITLRLPNGPSAQSPGGSANPSFWLVLLFGLSMFVLLTFWAKLNPDLDVRIVNDKRIFATALGALTYWLTIRALAAEQNRSLSEMIVAALTVGIPGTALILFAREVFDLFMLPDGSEGFARNLRWLLLWGGYYGAWVTGFVAVAYYRRATVSVAAPVAAPCVFPVRAAEPEDADNWLIDTIADELADRALDRRGLARRLRLRAGYEQADAERDPAASRDNARRALAFRVAARLESARF